MSKAGGQNRSERNSQVLNNAKSGFRLCDKFREPHQRNRNQGRKIWPWIMQWMQIFHHEDAARKF
jgi:hypothetical protein